MTNRSAQAITNFSLNGGHKFWITLYCVMFFPNSYNVCTRCFNACGGTFECFSLLLLFCWISLECDVFVLQSTQETPPGGVLITPSSPYFQTSALSRQPITHLLMIIISELITPPRLLWEIRSWFRKWYPHISICRSWDPVALKKDLSLVAFFPWSHNYVHRNHTIAPKNWSHHSARHPLEGLTQHTGDRWERFDQEVCSCECDRQKNFDLDPKRTRSIRFYFFFFLFSKIVLVCKIFVQCIKYRSDWQRYRNP